MIKIVEEPKNEGLQRLGYEHCVFCNVKTTTWHYPSNSPVCAACSKKHKVKDIPKD